MNLFGSPESFEELWNRHTGIIHIRSALSTDERVAVAQVSEESGQLVIRFVSWQEPRETARDEEIG